MLLSLIYCFVKFLVNIHKFLLRLIKVGYKKGKDL